MSIPLKCIGRKIELIESFLQRITHRVTDEKTSVVGRERLLYFDVSEIDLVDAKIGIVLAYMLYK